MNAPWLEPTFVDRDVYERTVALFREASIVLPTLAELAEPAKIPERIRAALGSMAPDAPHPLNLFRVRWFNDRSRSGQLDVPDHIVLPLALTGVDATDRGRPWRPVPADQRPQGVGGVRLPGSAARPGQLRPDLSSRGLALHRQLFAAEEWPSLGSRAAAA